MTAVAVGSATPSSNVLADLLPASRVRTIALVVGFALLMGVSGQIQFALPWTPVPITGQTFVVLLGGATLGSAAGAASMGLFVLLGLIGLPFYADGTSGWSVLSGATGGYLVGFIFASFIVGKLAEKKQDREFLTSIPAMLMGTAIIYLFGVTWLAHELNIGATKAITLGATPFVIGDMIKLLLAGVALPVAWKFAKSDD